jgi:hypothetical protein
LDPSRLRPSDFVDMSGLKRKRVHTGRDVCRISYSWYQSFIPFPAGTAGFLYYHNPLRDVLPMSGEVRFCITPSDDPSTFASGTDLLNPRSLPWSVPLILSKHNWYKPMMDCLLDNNLVTTEIIRECMAHGYGARQSSIIRSLGQPFSVKMDSPLVTIIIIAKDECRRASMPGFFKHRHGSLVAPYSGWLLT